MAQMSITPNTLDTVLKEFDHLLLRRHRIAEFRFNPDQLARMFFSRDEWARIAWLMRSPESRKVLVHCHNIQTVEIDGYKFNFRHNTSRSIVSRYSGPQTIHWDNEVAPYFRMWVDQQLKITKENERCYKLISSVMRKATTWPQVKKWWPEIVKVTHSFRQLPDPKFYWRRYTLDRYIPDMSEVDPRSARNVDPELGALVNQDSRFVVATLLQAMMMPTLDDKNFDEEIPAERRWLRYETRPVYSMHGWHTSSAR